MSPMKLTFGRPAPSSKYRRFPKEGEEEEGEEGEEGDREINTTPTPPMNRWSRFFNPAPLSSSWSILVCLVALLSLAGLIALRLLLVTLAHNSASWLSYSILTLPSSSSIAIVRGVVKVNEEKGLNYDTTQEEAEALAVIEFIDFTARFNKTYASAEEERFRFAIFTQHLREIKMANSAAAMRGGNARFGVNQFADMTPDEMSRYIMPLAYLGHLRATLSQQQVSIPRHQRRRYHGGGIGPRGPPSWDWRHYGVVTDIKNQLKCGSCWAFATAAVVESQLALAQLRSNSTPTRTTLSEQELVDCDVADNGCDGGFRPNAFEFVKQRGLLPDSMYPYTGVDGSCRLPPDNNYDDPSSNADDDDVHPDANYNKPYIKHSSSGSVEEERDGGGSSGESNERKPGRVYVDRVVGLPPNEDAMATYLVEKGPVSVGLAVTREMFSYRSGVFDPTPEDCATKAVGSHAMEVIGYGVEHFHADDGNNATVAYWILKNSWGPLYGVNGGYLHMRRGVDSCGLARAIYTALIEK